MLKHYIYSLLVALTMLATSAHAVLPAAVGTTFAGITDDINALFGLTFPVVALGLGLMIVIRLFKRFGNKV